MVAHKSAQPKPRSHETSRNLSQAQDGKCRETYTSQLLPAGGNGFSGPPHTHTHTRARTVALSVAQEFRLSHRCHTHGPFLWGVFFPSVGLFSGFEMDLSVVGQHGAASKGEDEKFGKQFYYTDHCPMIGSILVFASSVHQQKGALISGIWIYFLCCYPSFSLYLH